MPQPRDQGGTVAPQGHICSMEKLIALTIVIGIVAFASAYALSAW
ncbi:hypothetical protein [Bradyrhizobium sp. dw_78]|nr:hypothetical protein [Bradyrhizobium sp. dw_78]